MIVAGIMSGTSADGVDVALLQIEDGPVEYGYETHPRLELLAHSAFPYSPRLRHAVLDAMNAPATSTAELARLNWRLGLAYADALRAILDRYPLKPELVGCHGQTLYHQAVPQTYLGARFACTWQAGEAAILAGELNLPVVSNFRPADVVAGGQGAPLVSLLDFVLFRHPVRGRILQNIGGIANITAIPPAAEAAQCIAFDCGPGNMVMDALMLKLYRRPMDRDGAIAAAGSVLTPVVHQALSHPYFRKRLPKTTGREEFGRAYAAEFLAQCRAWSRRKEDAVATATALTTATITAAYRRFCAPLMGSTQVDYIVSGGGARNATLMRMLTESLRANPCNVTTIDGFGLPSEAKEAAAFALLAWQTWHHRAGNLPAATGARRPAILGQITYV